MKKSLITLAIGTIAATALLGACGDDDKSSDGGSGDTAAAGGNDAYCAKAEAFELASDALDSTFENPTEESLRTAFETIEPLLQSLATDAPAEVQADVDTLSVPLLDLIELVRSYDWDFAAVQTDPAFADFNAELESAETTQAQDRMNAWALDTCGLDMAD